MSKQFSKKVINPELRANLSTKKNDTLGTFCRKLLLKYKKLRLDPTANQNGFLQKIDQNSQLFSLCISHGDDPLAMSLPNVYKEEKIYMPHSLKISKTINNKARKFQALSANRLDFGCSLDSKLNKMLGISTENWQSKSLRINKKDIQTLRQAQTLDHSIYISQSITKSPSKSHRNCLNQQKHKTSYNLNNGKSGRSYYHHKNNGKLASLSPQRKQSISGWKTQELFESLL